MFENQETAKRVLETFLDINGQMDNCIRAVENTVSPSELKEFKKAIGYVMYEVFDKIIEPIVKQHPSLKPSGMDA